MHSFEVWLETEVKALLQANFDDNPFKYWDKDKAYADIQLKDANAIVRVKPIRYKTNLNFCLLYTSPSPRD